MTIKVKVSVTYSDSRFANLESEKFISWQEFAQEKDLLPIHGIVSEKEPYYLPKSETDDTLVQHGTFTVTYKRVET